jgi:hypothetical protein
MGAQLAHTVFLQDPDSHQTVVLEPGTCPEDRLARLVTNPSAWVDGKLPRLKMPAKATTGKEPGESQDPTGGDPDGASGDASDSAPGDASPTGDDQAAPAAKKTTARKTAVTKPARGRDAADEGSSGE